MSDASPKKPGLIEQPHFSSLLLDTIDSLVAVLDREGRILSFNKACEKTTGYSFKEVKGHHVWEFLIPEEQIDAVCDVFSRLKAGDFPNKYENHWLTKDGGKRLISWSNTCLLDENRDVEYVVQTGVDITESRQVEDALRASEERLAFAIKASGQGFYDVNLITGEAIVSDEYARMLGYESEELHETNQKWLERLHPDDRERIEQYFKDYIEGKKAEYSIEFRQKTKNGSWVDILSMGKVMERDDQGKPLRMLGVHLNITERKQADNELKQSEERFRLLLNSTAEAIFGVDQQGVCTFVNSACVEMLGYKTEADLIGQHMHALIHHTYPDGRAYPKEKCNVRLSTLEGKVAHSDDEVHWRADGSSFPVEYWSHPIYQDDVLVGAVVTFIDITERKRAEQQLLKLKQAVEQTADAIMITDLKGAIEYVNPAFERISGYIAAEVIGKDPSLFKSGKHSDGFYRQLWQQLAEGKVFSDVFINKRRDGSCYYDERIIAPIKNDKGETTHYVATGRDITDRVETEQQLKYLAHHDVLTDLPNRVLFLDRLKQALARARWHGRTVAIMFIDLDRFKNINDTLGHEAGDQLLRQFAGRLIGCLRDRDTIGRFGGDEFVVLLDDIAHVADLELLAQKILDIMKEAFVMDDSFFHVTASIGISMFPNDGEDTSTLLRNADLAMYRAKDAGRNGFEFYSSEMTVRAFERLNMESSLRMALERNEYVLHYQPQVNIHSGQIVGVEALIRWQHPELGLMLPDRFVPCLEDTGLIIPVGEWVLRNACAQLALWRKQGYEKLRMSVNMSSRQFNSPRLVDEVTELMQTYQLPKNVLELEITESVMMSYADSAQQLFDAFKELGVRLAIDDFGTGYSSLSYLRRLSIDTLKIDRSFIVDCPVNPDDAAIAEAIVSLAHTLRLDVVAEGVETGGQLEFLNLIGCNVAQGYLFSKALPSDELSQILQTQPLRSEI